MARRREEGEGGGDYGMNVRGSKDSVLPKI